MGPAQREQKVTKLIHMLEAQRHELPIPDHASDPHTSALKEGINATQVASVLKQSELADDTPQRPPGAT